MHRRLLAVAASAALAIGLSSVTADAATTLQGAVGPSFTITLKKSGRKVSSLRHGTYTIRISDRSNIHNFHLSGPGVNKKTSVSGTGTTTWTVRLRRGTYRYVCDPHATQMKGSFRVT